MQKSRRKKLVAVVVAAVIVTWYGFGLGDYFSLAQLKQQQVAITQWTQGNLLLSATLFTLLYTVMAALSLPGAAIFTLAGGALFGLGLGVVLVSIASTIGATLAFLMSRFLLRDWVQEEFGERLKAINAGIEKDGAFYLFSLRLVPVFPFFVINLLMGLTPISTRTYFGVSWLGMLPATFVYVYAGTQLAGVDSLSGILSPGIITAFVLLGVFPLLAKVVIGLLQRRQVLAGWSRPASFDRNLIVIGAGAGGLVTAYIGAALKAKVTLVEKDRMGGDCLNSGCVPSKALIRSARFLADVRRAAALGVSSASATADLGNVMARVRRIIQQIAPHDSTERYTKLGVEVIHGAATLQSPWEVSIETDTGPVSLSSRAIVIATGAYPFVPPIKGIETVEPRTSDTIWALESLPRRLLILGGGPIGCELAQAFQRLGSAVTLVEMLPRLLIREDEDVSALMAKQLAADGVVLLTAHRAIEFRNDGDEKSLICEVLAGEHDTKVIAFDTLLVAVGRKANTKGYGLERLDIPINDNGTIRTNDYLQTCYPNIYAVGDVAGPYQFTHTAAHQGWYGAVNALFDPLKKFRADYRVIPWATFTDPEVARVGLNEAEARQNDVDYEVTTFGLDELDRAITDEAAVGFIKVITPKGKDQILGVTIVGEHASDIIAEYVLAMKHGIGLNKVLGTIHIYPTFAEANKYVAGNWKKAHAPQRLLQRLARFHAWRR